MIHQRDVRIECPVCSFDDLDFVEMDSPFVVYLKCADCGNKVKAKWRIHDELTLTLYWEAEEI